MSILSEIKKLSGKRTVNSSRPAPEIRQSHETRSFDIPVRTTSGRDYDELKDELARTNEVLAAIKTEVANLENMQDSMKNFFEEQKKDTAESIHKENVKVYRNVQAVVVDESAKLKESFEKSTTGAYSKVNLAMIFSICAFGIALLHFIFDILCKAGIF